MDRGRLTRGSGIRGSIARCAPVARTRGSRTATSSAQPLLRARVGRRESKRAWLSFSSARAEAENRRSRSRWRDRAGRCSATMASCSSRSPTPCWCMAGGPSRWSARPCRSVFPELRGARSRSAGEGRAKRASRSKPRTRGHARLGAYGVHHSRRERLTPHCGQAHALAALMRQSPWVLLGDATSAHAFQGARPDCRIGSRVRARARSRGAAPHRRPVRLAA